MRLVPAPPPKPDLTGGARGSARSVVTIACGPDALDHRFSLLRLFLGLTRTLGRGFASPIFIALPWPVPIRVLALRADARLLRLVPRHPLMPAAPTAIAPE